MTFQAHTAVYQTCRTRKNCYVRAVWPHLHLSMLSGGEQKLPQAVNAPEALGGRSWGEGFWSSSHEQGL
jgi:hypothetical protein